VEAELSTNHFFGSSESAHGKVFASALATSMAVLMPVVWWLTVEMAEHSANQAG
jgi:hypothetical protein